MRNLLPLLPRPENESAYRQSPSDAPVVCLALALAVLVLAARIVSML